MVIFIALISTMVVLQGIEGLKSVRIRVPPIVRSGDTVTLSCNYDLEEVALYTIKWYRDEEEFYRFVPKESPPSRAFTMAHIDVDIAKSGATEVTLRRVSRELTGNYKCEVSADAPLFHTDIKVAYMTVVEVPESAPTLRIDPRKVEIGKRIEATCYTNGSDPATNITWYINDELVTETHDDVRIFPKKQTKNLAVDLLDTRSRVEIIANKSFFITGLMVLKCHASIYSVWGKSTEGFIRDETPYLAPVLLSTSSQTHEADSFDIFSRNACNMSYNQSGTLVFILLIFRLMLQR